MRRNLMRIAVLGVIGSMLACASAEGQPAAAPGASARSTAPAAAHGPVIVELFTSQGCSSCPPADRVLAKLAEQPGVAPLAFHVDYWNELGWEDPYSASAWTDRQRMYARALHDTRVYTPEIVVGGAVGMVGSKARAVSEAIGRAELPALLDARATWSPGSVEVTATAPAGADVMVAVWEAHRENAVPSGENAGSTLDSTRVVRKLERVATAGASGHVTIELDAAWTGVGAVAFAQRPDARVVASVLLTK